MKWILVSLVLLVPCVAQAQFAGQLPAVDEGFAAGAASGGEVEWARAQELVQRFRARQAEADQIVTENQVVRNFVCRNLGCAGVTPRPFPRPFPVAESYVEEVPVCESRAGFDFNALRERQAFDFAALREREAYDFARLQELRAMEFGGGYFMPVGRSRTRVDIRVRERGGFRERFGGRAGVGVNIGVGAGFGCRTGGCY